METRARMKSPATSGRSARVSTAQSRAQHQIDVAENQRVDRLADRLARLDVKRGKALLITHEWLQKNEWLVANYRSTLSDSRRRQQQLQELRKAELENLTYLTEEYCKEEKYKREELEAQVRQLINGRFGKMEEMV